MPSKSTINTKSLDQAIDEFNKWDGAAILYYNKEFDYFNTIVFINDVAKSETVLDDDCFSVISKNESDTFKIGEKRRAYILDYVELILKGWYPYQAEYHLLEKYPFI